MHNPDEILHFWFHEVSPQQWWVASTAFDQQIAERFTALHTAAARCELYAWRETAEGRLAEIIVLDQLSRNLYRNQPQAFACDGQALALAQTAVAMKGDQRLSASQRQFLYMPYMHSESASIHATGLPLFAVPGLEQALEFAQQHKNIIDRFGRYPHRNTILDRISSEEELAFLQAPNSSF